MPPKSRRAARLGDDSESIRGIPPWRLMSGKDWSGDFCTGNRRSRRGIVRTESRWPPAFVVLVFVVLNTGLRLWLPAEDVIAVPWLAPLIELVLLGVLVASDPLGVDRRSRWLRRV